MDYVLGPLGWSPHVCLAPAGGSNANARDGHHISVLWANSVRITRLLDDKMTFPEATAEFSWVGGVWIVMFVSNPTKIVVKATLLLSVGVTYVKFENLNNATDGSTKSMNILYPHLKSWSFQPDFNFRGFRFVFEGNIGWEKSENMDWLF